MVKVSVDLLDNYCLIQVDGEVDASSSIHLDEAMQKAVDASCPNVLVDCSKLNYISSAGLGVFMSYIQEMEAKEKKLILFNMFEKVYKVFEILGLHQLLSIVDTEQEAKKELVG